MWSQADWTVVYFELGWVFQFAILNCGPPKFRLRIEPNFSFSSLECISNPISKQKEQIFGVGVLISCFKWATKERRIVLNEVKLVYEWSRWNQYWSRGKTSNMIWREPIVYSLSGISMSQCVRYHELVKLQNTEDILQSNHAIRFSYVPRNIWPLGLIDSGFIF